MKNYPVILRGVIASVVVGTFDALDDARGLQNRTDRTLRIRELRFRLADASTPSTVHAEQFGDISVQIRHGNTPMTAGFVPLSAIVTPVDISIDGESNDLVFTDTGAQMPYIIRLRKPVLLAPGERLSLQIQHLNLTGAGHNTLIEVLAICEEADLGAQAYMPWMASYSTPIHNDGAGVFEDISTEADLANPFDDEVFVERLIGRTFYNSHVVSGGVTLERFLIYDAVRLRIEDHHATSIVRDPTPIAVVMDTIWKSWRINADLASKGFYRVSVESRLAPQVTTGALPVQTVIGMLGYRAVR